MPLSGGIKRRNAKRDHNVIYEQLGHEFQRHYFSDGDKLNLHLNVKVKFRSILIRVATK